MKKVILILCVLFSMVSIVNAQIYIDNDGNVYDNRDTQTNEDKPRIDTPKKEKAPSSGFDKSRLGFGGGLGLQFGRDETLISVSPQVGYSFSKYLVLGGGVGYTYFKHDYYSSTYKQHLASLNVFGRVYPFNPVVLSVQPEIGYMWQSIDGRDGSYSENSVVPSLLVGGGIRFGPMMAMIQYDVVQNKYSPYGNTLFYSIGYYITF